MPAPKHIGRLWWAAMDKMGRLHDGVVAKGKEEGRAWTYVFSIAHYLLRVIRRSHGRLPKPPGLEEMQQEAATHVRKPTEEV